MIRPWFLSALLLAACTGDPDEKTTDSTPLEETGDSDSGGPVDGDADGYTADVDCDDANAAVHPDAAELCDELDNDCDGSTDEEPTDATTWYADADGDTFGDVGVSTTACTAPEGYVSNSGDCDDGSPTINPGMEDFCDLLDNDCDGDTDEDEGPESFYADEDGDHYGDPDDFIVACVAPGDRVSNDSDCDDSDSTVHPGSRDVCNGIDDNCDGDVDEDEAPGTWYTDADGDTYGDVTTATVACDAPEGAVAEGTDCDDADPLVNPGAVEACNSFDDDCDGSIDEDVSATTWYADADGDLYGDPATALSGCVAPEGWVTDGTDCNDLNATINPGAIEDCNSLDDDCDGTADEDAAPANWYADADHDGYGDVTVSTEACAPPSGFVSDATDCNDAAAAVHPDAAEVCDGLDNDCDGAEDEDAAPSTWYADNDHDGYGDATVTTDACTAPTGFISDATDCNDAAATIHPGASELCDSLDNDCDGSTDEDTTSVTWYADADGDTYGDATVSTVACIPPSGHVLDATDCNDHAASVHPGLTDVCDSVDQDCDGSVDEDDPAETWYADVDGDGYGDATSSTSACTAPSAHVSNSTDCNDHAAGVHPGLSDTCDSVDQDCDGSTDEDATFSMWYADSDGDGFGDSATGTEACAAPAEHVSDATDCDDADDLLYDTCAVVFDGTFGSAWETLATSPDVPASLQAFHPSGTLLYNMDDEYGQAYDPDANSWSTLTNPAPAWRGWNAMAPWGGMLYGFIGDTFYGYDPTMDAWSTLAMVGTTDGGTSTESDVFGMLYAYGADGLLLVLGAADEYMDVVDLGLGVLNEPRLGYDASTHGLYLAAFDAPELYRYDLDTGAVTEVTPIPEPTMNDIFCSDRWGHLYAAGDSAGATMWQYTTETDTWTALPDLPTEHGNNSTCTVSEDGWLYVGTDTQEFYRLALY